MFRPDRRRRAGPLLEWKVRLFVLAAVLGLAGIYLDQRRLTGGAIGVLLVGVLFRLLPKAARHDGDVSDQTVDDEDTGSGQPER